MDGREKLRRYLEQRREMGETELVLDSMTVEEALRIVSGGSAPQPVERSAERPVHRDAPSLPGPPLAGARIGRVARNAFPANGDQASRAPHTDTTAPDCHSRGRYAATQIRISQ